ncbi:MAG: cell division protein ZapA [Lachnospiraceae bacterium]|jgi:cell division protein ZapA|nr:cell division protein ZapA [Lachnospiraceae bacterium]MBR3637801.1 cell division protein ZapA [Lachnospiraceae bacterium]
MSAKIDTEVIVGGKVFTISGYESEEYLQKVAAYLNGKFNEFNKEDGFRRLTLDYQNLLIQFNIADDYFKAKNQISLLEDELKGREDDLCNIKHELIATQIKMDNQEKNINTLRADLAEKEKKIIRLETELKERERKENK